MSSDFIPPGVFMPPGSHPARSPQADACPLPRSRYEHVLLGHGGGGQLGSDLVRDVFLARLGNCVLNALEDQATLALGCEWPVGAGGAGGAAARGRVAVATDAFVVQPLFFPGGDIGRLAVCGTVNDLVVGGAEPLCLAAAFVLEEGLPVETLTRIVGSMGRTCEEVGVTVVAGDTKVVERGKGDGVFITTTGIGVIPEGRRLSISAARPGDGVIVSGSLGDHGIAIMSAREGLEFETELVSDCAPLGDLVRRALDACPSPSGIRAMRDPTRGGLASAINEVAAASRVGVELEEAVIPIRPEVHAACEMLGLDPLYAACEGRLVAIVSQEHADDVVDAMRAHPLGRNAQLIGRVVAEHPGVVTVRTLVGGERVLAMLSGEQLPRIC